MSNEALLDSIAKPVIYCANLLPKKKISTYTKMMASRINIKTLLYPVKPATYLRRLTEAILSKIENKKHTP